MYFKQSRREKIYWIILGFDPPDYSRQDKYCRLRILKF